MTSGVRVKFNMSRWVAPELLYGMFGYHHIRVFYWSWRKRPYTAFYYTAEDGILLGVKGYGQTPDEAVRQLWRKLHS